MTVRLISDTEAETINSMLKRDWGDHLRSRLPRSPKAEVVFCRGVYNMMLAGNLEAG